MTSQSETEVERPSSYPDYVIKTRCLECRAVYYARHHATYCPYCGEESANHEGSGVVCHNAE